ncbi:MAG: hypothetical protein MZV70_52375 [Desulfobacterales bacterium]|nr:hypothetical protein [Desulfobacterales bacterium]
MISVRNARRKRRRPGLHRSLLESSAMAGFFQGEEDPWLEFTLDRRGKYDDFKRKYKKERYKGEWRRNPQRSADRGGPRRGDRAGGSAR